ncbi:MAG: TonB-dependent receptor [Bacteroidales bacterium]|nr:TonB-dependent receptor [Bacteroidales bacterium]
MKYIYKIKSSLLIQLMLLFAGLFITHVEMQAQEPEIITVQGIVYDQADQPLVGATIVIEGTTTGTVTDIDGKFSLPCPKGCTLAIGFVGYKGQLLTVSSADKLTVVLEENVIALEEAIVVAVGYGTMRKSDLTGAIASVSSEKFKKGIVSSSEQLLQGKVAGLNVVQGSGDPAAGASLRLRGGTSLQASNSPLIVVDGIPGVDFNSVQPSEIVSIDILKDASAAAIYGSRGANGVIIVTTNRADKGKRAEYNGYVAFGTVANHLDLLSADQWRAYVRENNVVGAVDYGADTDWQKEIEQTSISHSHTLAFSNARESGGYRISLNYLYNDGVIKTSHLDRLGGSISANQDVWDDRLKLEAGIHSNFDKWNPVDNGIFERSYNLCPTIPVKNEQGEYTQITGTAYENPVELNTHRYADNTRHRFLGYGKAELKIIRDLKGVVNVSYEYNSMQTNYYRPSYAFIEGRDIKGRGQKTLADYRNMQFEGYLTWDSKFGENHKYNLMAGYSYLDNTYEGFGAERRGFDTDLFLYNNLDAGQDYRVTDVYSYKGNAKLISFFGRANYSFKGRYMFTATLRRDGSSRFGENHEWGMFPSASFAWRISDEVFMQGLQPWLNNLKLRIGYGVTGNQEGIGEYKSLSILGAGGASYYDATTDTWKQAYRPAQNPNPDLKWESTAQSNIGLDFALIGRIYGTIEVYEKKTSDLLFSYAVPQPPNLYQYTMANVGDLTNTGIELTLNANVLSKADISWDVNLTASHNVQKITELSDKTYKTEAVQTGPLHDIRGMSNQYAQTIREDYPVGTFWGPECLGLDSLGQFILVNEDSGQYLGNAQPKFSMGFGTTFIYRNFDLDIATYGMFGQKVLNASAMSMNDPSRLPAQNVPDALLDDKMKPKITSDATYSSYWIEDASFFRIQSVTLGYKIKATKLGFEKIRLYVTGENLLVLTNYTGVDPEVSISDLNNVGIDKFNYYPKPRTIIIGLNLAF